MEFNRHSRLEGLHATLSASSHHWVGYDVDKMTQRFITMQAARKGTELHEFAAQAVKLGIKLPGNKLTMSRYVNDAIGYRMNPEQILYYSDNCFGTADAVSFRRNKLRIHDLKTGTSPASMRQLEIYASMFCLEYGVKPGEIEMELRIYQNDDVMIHVPELDDILHIMGKIITFDKLLDNLREEALV